VSLISPGTVPRYIAASDASALRFERLQTDLEEGPCLLAYETGEAVTVPNLQLETRFPRFAERALDAGLRAVFTYPLRHGDERLGALDLYREAPGPFDDRAMAAAQTLADVAAAYLLNAQARADLLEASQRASEESLHDMLTGLPNRAALLERLDHAVRRSKRSKRPTAILFIDLDRLKSVNDQHGHGLGDELLRAVASRLTATKRVEDTLARLYGDEFVMVCEDVADAAEAEHIASRVLRTVRLPFDLSSATVSITASVGISLTGPTEQSPQQLLDSADVAMYRAKRRGGGQAQVTGRGERDCTSEPRKGSASAADPDVA
jgi:diguanylate cyclase (GGDEF)-like protein